MDVLEIALRPVARLLNRNIQDSTPARELCAALDNTVIAVRVRNTALSAYFCIDNEILAVVSDEAREPDVSITGSLLTLASMAGQAGDNAVRDGSLEMTGDAELAAQFQKLLALAKPDIEEELSNVVGDVAAHRLGGLARGIGRWGREARTTMGENIREYLQEESRDAPSRYEVDRFSTGVNEVRDAVDRLEARINRLKDNR